MTDTNILDLGIGKLDRTVTVDSIEEIEVPVSGSMSKKVLFKVSQSDGRTFNISDTWVKDSKGGLKIQGLWLTLDEKGNLAANSTVAKLLKHYQVKNLRDIVGMEVKTFPDQNNYLVFAACNTNELEKMFATPVQEEKANLFD